MEVISLIEWLKEKNLRIAPEKTEFMLLDGRRNLSDIEVQVEDRDVKSLKYLGVVFDKDLQMTEHVKQMTVRANDVATKLARLMPNNSGPRFSKSRVICGAVSSIVLYGALS